MHMYKDRFEFRLLQEWWLLREGMSSDFKFFNWGYPQLLFQSLMWEVKVVALWSL